jgi:tRNA nucleotidyltransferase (CCA-adding enzyme)
MGLEEVEARAAIARLIPVEVEEVAEVLARAGFRAWAVGGGVRDAILAGCLGRDVVPGDWDLATDALPLQVKPLFRRVIPTGIAHGTVTVLHKGSSFEVTTLRGEEGHSDGRRPDSVFFVSEIEKDLARRDFTVNAIAYDLKDKTIADPFGGIQDLEQGIIRAVGDPAARYQEDGLRPLRAARFSAQLEMSLEEGTRAAIRPSLERFSRVSVERVQAEWFKALRSRCPSRCFRILLEDGLLQVTCPALFAAPPREPIEAIWARLDGAAPNPVRRLAHLLYDGLSLPEKELPDTLDRLRLSNHDRNEVVGLVAAASLPEELSAEAVRKWLSARGRALAPSALAFAQERGAPESFLTLATEELKSGVPLAVVELAISGKDLIDAQVVEKGPRVRALLFSLLSHTFAHPEDNDPNRLLALARELARAER